MKALFRAKYAMLLLGGETRPVLQPADGPALPEVAGYPIARGDCELHLLGGGVLGFTVSGPQSRELDARVLDKVFLEAAPPVAIAPEQPFSSRLPATRREEP